MRLDFMNDGGRLETGGEEWRIEERMNKRITTMITE